MPSIKSIETETDYETALAEIERLWDSEPDTPAEEALLALVTLVEAYEKVHYPIHLPEEANSDYAHVHGLAQVKTDSSMSNSQ